LQYRFKPSFIQEQRNSYVCYITRFNLKKVDSFIIPALKAKGVTTGYDDIGQERQERMR
jgi:hypothetical protein